MYNANDEEKKILEFWDKDKTFEKSVNERPENRPYVFYDGPPFATGLPHYGHFPSSIMKDAVPRYWTMNGYRVERRWGWDCHGLPIENIVEKELGTKTKKEIEALGVAKFNELCRSKVLGYVPEWKKTIHRLGRWVDMDNAYRTMDRDYMESVWWVFKQLWDKNLIYEDYRSMHICPRCETTLSQQEVSEGYKDVKDISVFVKFKITNLKSAINTEYEIPEGTKLNILAWTTTPWTLPGNVALAVGSDIDYVLVRFQNVGGLVDKDPQFVYVILAKDIYKKWDADPNSLRDVADIRKYFVGSNLSAEFIPHGRRDILAEFKGSALQDSSYEPLFPYYRDHKNAFRVVAGDFVTTEDGTGVVHIAPGFGEDDFKVGKREQIPMLQHVGLDGRFKPEVIDFAGKEVKPRSDDDKERLSADIAILKYLQEHGSFFAKQNLVHSYPHCWRCDTPLLNYATTSWFVKVTAIKEQALTIAQKINWSPEHIKEGRFGKWLEGARDWSISRQRFWASVMPVWRCEGCKEYAVFGAVADLEKASGKKIDDLHKHIVDDITVACEKCQGTMRRIPDVLDTWFDSGSMPYAQVHYPFDNKEKFEKSFPAQFIAEGQDQTRAWFYYLHVLATALTLDTKSIPLAPTPAFSNVIVNGIVLAEDGKKMSKKLKNYPDPNLMVEKYGADALRYYLLTSPVMKADNLNFAEAGVREVFSKVVNTLFNVVEFYSLFAKSGAPAHGESVNVLDQWIVAKLNALVATVTENMNSYHLVEAARPIEDFITDLSQWYVRRSRDRFKGDDEKDKAAALATLKQVLETLAKVMAPFMPFMAEKVWQDVGNKTSVHLEMWPVAQKADEAVLTEMAEARTVVELGLAARAEAGIKIRQPLANLFIDVKLSKNLLEVVADELNVKNVEHGKGGGVAKTGNNIAVVLDTKLTLELKAEGLMREIVRTLNQLRKEKGFTIQDRAIVTYATSDADIKNAFETFAVDIKQATLTKSLEEGIGLVPRSFSEGGADEVEIDGKKVTINIAK